MSKLVIQLEKLGHFSVAWKSSHSFDRGILPETQIVSLNKEVWSSHSPSVDDCSFPSSPSVLLLSPHPLFSSRYYLDDIHLSQTFWSSQGMFFCYLEVSPIWYPAFHYSGRSEMWEMAFYPHVSLCM